MKTIFQILTVICLSLPAHVSAQLSPYDAVALMQKGINLGNTLEPPLEGGWNNPPAQEYYFDLYQQAGFHTVRVPVRWDQHTSYTAPFTIDASWLSRVEQVIDWALDRDLFVIVNAHHDDWIKQNYTDATYRARFDSIWSQISMRFKDQPEKLLFEILNEPHGLTKVQNDDMHARVLSIIRKTNPTRIVIIQGHNWGGSDELITAAVPDDNYIIGSFHSYDPYLFGLEGQGTWGTTTDYNTLKNKFIAVKNWSDDHRVPVILGEFGSLRSCDYNSRMKHYRAYVELSQQYGFVSCAWDDGGDFRIMERAARKWDEVKDILIHTTADAPRNINLSLLRDTIIQLSWTNATTDADSIYIEHRTPSGVFSRIATLPGDTSLFLHINAADEIYHHYRIIAHDVSGEEYFSQPIRIFLPEYVQKIRGFFLGVPLNIPGTIEAEDFDTGGEGLAYHDASATNVGGAYRTTEAVDIYDRNGDGYHISNIWPGEWFEHTVTVEQDGSYIIDFHVAAREAGGTFILRIGEAETRTMTAPNTYSTLITTVISDTIDLTAGEQIMRFTVLDDPYFSIDKMVFTAYSTITKTQDISKQPFTFALYPDRQALFTFDREAGIQEIQFYDVEGRMIRNISHPGEQIKVSFDEPAGVYIIRAISPREQYVTKFLIY